MYTANKSAIKLPVATLFSQDNDEGNVWDVATCNRIEMCRCELGPFFACCLFIGFLFDLENGSCLFIRNIGEDYTA